MMGIERGARRANRRVEVVGRSNEIVRRLGLEVAAARRRRGLTQYRLASRTGISRASLSRIELGHGQGVPMATWLALAAELGLTARFGLQRDWREEPADAGHLAVQDLVLRLGRSSGYDRSFELPTRARDPARSIDVCLRSDQQRRLIVAEAWNTIGDVGAGVRSFTRKQAEAVQLAVVLGRERPHTVHGVWVVRATARNRALIVRYPEVFAAAFPGSSALWLRALTAGTPPPALPGLVWCDVAATRLFAWRSPSRGPDTPSRATR
jgi:transcriptional regulator with XRE-family HTH domain